MTIRAPRLEPTTREARKTHSLRCWLRRIIESKPVQGTKQELLMFANWQRGVTPRQVRPVVWHATKDMDKNARVPLADQITGVLNNDAATVRATLAVYDQDTAVAIPTPVMLPGAMPRQTATTDPLRIIPAMCDDAPAPERVPWMIYSSSLTSMSACVIDAMQRFRAKYPSWEIGSIQMHPTNLLILQTMTRDNAPYIGIPMQSNRTLTGDQIMVFGAAK